MKSKWNNIEKGYNCIQYKNNFEQLERIIGNNNNEDDDNVETLTGNADGNDVGTE